MGKELICLDTSILIEYYRKKDKSETKFVQLSKNYSFAISVIAKFKILTGINENQQEFWEQVFKKVKIFSLQETDIEIAAQILKNLKKRNKLIGLKDILIASSAIANGLPLSTLNLKDFIRIENLVIINE
ncbi:MAG: type II toxin-antitoxin system VapC family toxin [Bacteroidetes bacterium]|nr:MAG: type II toxin-antitoxin system VapC family toxin [Bacteroidota bacterium]